MTRPDQTEMVVTLSEDDSTGEPDWARTLNALRTRNRATAATPQTIAAEAQREQLARELSDSYPNTNTLRPFGDRELDAAYREYLHQAAAEHNANPNIVEEDVGVLIQEDWLNAQTALQSEHNRRWLTETKTVILRHNLPEDGRVAPTEMLVSGSLNAETAAVPLPDIAIHVYDLPAVPATRRVRVLSEQELMQGIRERLKPHLSNAVAGMVRQALQKKLATLSYDLQTMLNEETPQVVQDVLDHNLNAVFRAVKDNLSGKK